LLFSRARFCFTGRRDFLSRSLICQGRFFLRPNHELRQKFCYPEGL